MEITKYALIKPKCLLENHKSFNNQDEEKKVKKKKTHKKSSERKKTHMAEKSLAKCLELEATMRKKLEEVNHEPQTCTTGKATPQYIFQLKSIHD